MGEYPHSYRLVWERPLTGGLAIIEYEFDYRRVSDTHNTLLHLSMLVRILEIGFISIDEYEMKTVQCIYARHCYKVVTVLILRWFYICETT